MDTFLLELYDRPALADINIDSIIDVQNKSLLYNNIYRDPQIHKKLCYSWVWQQFFGTRPSIIDSSAYSGPCDFDSIAKHIEDSTFLKYVKQVYEQGMAKYKLGFTMYKNNLETSQGFVKDELSKKLLERFCLTFEDFDSRFPSLTLFVQYKHITKKHSGSDDIKRAYDRKDMVEVNHLLNTLSKHVERTDFSNFGALNSYDFFRHVIVHDAYLMRLSFAKTALICFSPMTSDQASAALFALKEPGVTKPVVITVNQHPKLFKDLASNPTVMVARDYKELMCYPSVFHRAICWGSPAVFKIWTIQKQDTTYITPSSALPIDGVRTIAITTKNQLPAWKGPVISADSPLIKHGTKDLINIFSRFYKDPPDVGMPAYAHVLSKIVRYAIANKLDPTKLQTSPAAKNCVLVIDNRENFMSVLSACITFNNLKPKEWNLCIMTSEKAAQYYKTMFCNSDIVYITLDKLNKDVFDLDDYNDLLKDHDTWKYLEGFDNVLTIQDDGMLMRPGIEDKFLNKYDYVGAPWADADFNNELVTVGNPMMVGNGGLSLRNVKMLLDITRQEKGNPISLFNKDLQPIPEDVFFAHHVYKRNGRIPERALATEFATEQVFNPTSLGFHKPWVYMPFDNVDKVIPEQ